MLIDNKTIFAIATPPGKSGVAVIRISGKNALSGLSALIKDQLPKPRIASLKTLYHLKDDFIIDQAIVITFLEPNSFTGENVVELHIHGSRAISNILIEILSDLVNFRLALPGEFAQRAFFNGKFDLTQAEGLADLIEAETVIQQKQAMRQMQGELMSLYEQWRSKIIKTLSLLEAYIDFPDEDIPEEVLDEIALITAKIIQDLKQHLNDGQRGEIIRRGIYVSILGVPNAGKSTLLNFLAKRDIAIVSDIPGTTRDVMEVNLDLNGYLVTLADTAGIRDSADLIEQEGVRRALKQAAQADLKILLLTNDQTLNAQQQILEYLDDNSLVVLNKADLGNLNLPNAILISLKSHIGLDNLLDELGKKIATLYGLASDPAITRNRYRQNLKQTLECLQDFNLNNPLELACEDLRMASRYLGQITGKITVEDILDQIFANFCIGK